MKKVCKPICLLLAIVSIFAMAGCKKEEAKSSTPNGSTVSGDPSGKKYKVGIVQQLEQVNIHQASLFPEPDTVAQYLRRK